MSSKTDLAQRKRELRLQIGRSRRRVDRRIRAIQEDAIRLMSWETYLGRIPFWTWTALGAGLAGLSDWRKQHRSSDFGLAFLRRFGRLVLRRLRAARSSRKDHSTAADTVVTGSAPTGGDDRGA